MQKFSESDGTNDARAVIQMRNVAEMQRKYLTRRSSRFITIIIISYANEALSAGAID